MCPLKSRPGHPTLVTAFSRFSIVPLHQMSEWYRKLGHNRFISHIFQFVTPLYGPSYCSRRSINLQMKDLRFSHRYLVGCNSVQYPQSQLTFRNGKQRSACYLLHAVLLLCLLLTLKMEAECPSEMSVDFHRTTCVISQKI
jgi:hypothetical protein